METEKVTLGYWGFRGRAGLDRAMLAFCKVPFTSKIYTNPVDWFGKDKQEIGFDFPNLPYLIDGENKITEAKAIAKYIALKVGRRDLVGIDDDKKFIEIDIMYDVIDDLFNDILKLIVTKGDFQAEKEALFTTGKAKNRLDLLSKKLGEKEWLTGAATIADIFLFEMLDLINDIEAARVEKYKNLADFRTRFLAIPEIKAHRESEDFKPIWFYPGMTVWNNMPTQ